MEQEIKEALRGFFSATRELAQFDVIRSFHYTRDIAKYLCEVVYGFEAGKPRLPVGYDGRIGTAQVRVRFNNCPRGHKVNLQEPFAFDELIVVLGPNCALRPDDVQNAIVFYRFTKEEVLEKFRTPSARYVGGKELFSQEEPDRVLSLN